MNAPVLHGYGAASPVLDSRSAEAAILRRITGRMASAVAPQAGFPQLVTALEDNRRFWKQAALDLASAGNALPDALRATLISLAGFTEQQTSKILAGNASAEPLVAINSAVIRGLTDGAA